MTLVSHVRVIGVNGVNVVKHVMEGLKDANIESQDKQGQEERVVPIM